MLYSTDIVLKTSQAVGPSSRRRAAGLPGVTMPVMIRCKKTHKACCCLINSDFQPAKIGISLGKENTKDRPTYADILGS